MNEQINVMDIINMIVKRWWIVVLSTCVVGAVTFVISNYFITPQFTSSGKLIVSNTNERNDTAASINAINTSARLASTYMEVFKTDTFLSKIATDSGTNYTSDQLKGMVTYTSLNKTEVLQVDVKCKSKIDAKIINEMILDNAQEEVERIGNGGSVTIIDEASTPDTQTSPNVNLNTIVGILLGLLLGVLIVFVIEFFDTRIKGEDDLTSKYDFPILGVIPDMEINTNKGVQGNDKK